jgi:hypothetical protein
VLSKNRLLSCRSLNTVTAACAVTPSFTQMAARTCMLICCFQATRQVLASSVTWMRRWLRLGVRVPRQPSPALRGSAMVRCPGPAYDVAGPPKACNVHLWISQAHCMEREGRFWNEWHAQGRGVLNSDPPWMARNEMGFCQPLSVHALRILG